MSITEYERKAQTEAIKALSDKDLKKELSFATLADDPMPTAKSWLKILKAEAKERNIS